MDQMKLQAPAKLNWTLEVMGAFPEGHPNKDYSRLRSVMLLLDLADELEVICDQGSGETTVECSDERVPQKRKGNQRENTCFKAVSELRRHYPQLEKLDVHVRIHKRIPFAGGLGGSSTDGSAVLRALNEMCSLGLSNLELADFAAAFGSDTPFFAAGFPAALVEGRGEDVGALPAFPKGTSFVLVNPGIELQVANVFGALKKIDYSGCAANRRSDLSGDCALALRDGASLRTLSKFMVNDLERSPHIGEAFRERRMLCLALKDAGCLGAQMSGSGPTVFGVCESEATAQSAAKIVSGQFPKNTVIVSKAVEC